MKQYPENDDKAFQFFEGEWSYYFIIIILIGPRRLKNIRTNKKGFLYCYQIHSFKTSFNDCDEIAYEQ